MKTEDHSVLGDRALAEGQQDQLGFRDVAKQIAKSLVNPASDDGLVIGVEGAWGSGKSSLLYLIRQELEKQPPAQRPTVIEFQPWVIGNRDALIANLLGQLSIKLNEIALDAGSLARISADQAKKASISLKKFVLGLSRAGSALELVGDITGFIPAAWAGKGVKAVGELVGEESELLELPELKRTLSQSLKELRHRFIITIDDVDRLEPSEVIEILRLVRSVVDLPNVVYLLCYDSKIIAHSIEVATGTESGRSYLEKIVQLPVMVPTPEPFRLRQWFADELNNIAQVADEEELSRLKAVVDFEGARQLRTPRSVVRALDAIRFFWPPLSEARADLADLVWLQLIKNGNPELYRWIEDYCATAALISMDAVRLDAIDKSKELSDLMATVAAGHFNNQMYRHFFAEQLPAFESDYVHASGSFKIYQDVGNVERDSAIKKRRLSSPDHYRLYFAMVVPSYAITQEDTNKLWLATEIGADQAGSVLLRLHEQKVAGSLTKTDLILERIQGGAYEIFAQTQRDNFLSALALVMDEAFRIHPFEHFSISSVWDRAQAAIPHLISSSSVAHRAMVIRAMFTKGAAIGWLTSLFRSETFAHGRYGDRRLPDTEWLFSDAELDLISTIITARYREMSPSDLLNSPDPLSLLFAWYQTGDKHEPRDLVKKSISSDDGFVGLLMRLVTIVNSSAKGQFIIIRRQEVSPFLNYEEAEVRIAGLTEHPVLGEQALKLSRAFKAARER